MPIQDELSSQQRRLEQHRRNLRFLEEQAAIYGAGALPLSLHNQIEHERELIAAIEAGAETSRPARTASGPAAERAYLNWVVRCHEQIELPRVGEILPSIALDQVYVALRGDAASSFERSQNRRLLQQLVQELEEYVTAHEVSTETEYMLRSRALARSPYSVSLEERDLPTIYRRDDTTSMTLAEAFQRERRLVCLGDPGSGKTTLIRWLALKLARGLVLPAADGAVRVPAAQVDPASPPGAPDVNLGPARLPILVRVSRFAEARQRRPGLLLSEFLGGQTWIDDTPIYGGEAGELQGVKVPEHELNALMLEALRQSRAVVLIDGLDEVADLREREEVVAAVDHFIQQWIPAGEQLAIFATHEQGQLGVAFTTPQLIGGNQVVITSRIAGYHESELRSALAHVTIEPMGDVAVDRFCDAIIAALHRVDAAANAAPRRELATRESRGLRRAIHSPERRGLRELASNPLLVTILALLHHTGGSVLPSQRVELYQTTIARLGQVWRHRDVPLSETELFAVMAELAAHIHATSATGLIDEREIVRRLADYLTARRPDSAPRAAIDADVAQFVRVLRNDVGLLAARGQLLYGFLHLTFQEYLAGYQMVQNPARAGELLRARVGAPRWREPILMALGYASMEWERQQFEALLLDLLAMDNPIDTLLPRSALLIVAAVPDMLAVPAGVVRAVVERLLHTYADRQGLGQFASLREQIAVAFVILRRDERVSAVDRALCSALTRPPAHRPDVRLAAASIVAQHAWFTADIVDALSAAAPFDSADWGWVVDQALRRVASLGSTLPAPDARALVARLRGTPEWLSPDDEQVIRQLGPPTQRTSRPPPPRLAAPRRPNALRAELQRNAAALAFARQDQGWLRLLIVLAGGLGDYNASEARQEYMAALHQLKVGDRRQQQRVAIELDTKLLSRFQRSSQIPVQFEPQAMYRDTPIADVLLDGLRRRVASGDMPARLRAVAEQDRRPERRAEALLGLTALGEDIGASLAALADEPQGRQVAEQFHRQLDRARRMLSDPMVRLGNTFVHLIEQTPTFDDPWDADAILSALELLLRYGGATPNMITLLDRFPNAAKPRVLAETWALWLDPDNDDNVYNIAVVLDTQGRSLASAREVLAVSFASLGETRHHWWARTGTRVLSTSSIPLPRNEDILICALAGLEALPQELQFLRGWALTQLAPLFHTHSRTLLEATLLAYTGLRDDAYGVHVPALRALAPELLDDPRPLDTLERAARAIADPYFRCRAMLALSKWRPMQRANLLDEAQASATAIKDPVLRFVAVDRLIALLPEQSLGLVAQLEALLHTRSMPAEYAAYAWARLTLYRGHEQRCDALAEALQEIGRIDNQQLRATALRELGPQLTAEPQLRQAFAGAVARLESPLLRALATNRYGPFATQFAARFSGDDAHTATAILGLAATIEDLRQAESFGVQAGLWGRLASGDRADAIVQIQERGAASSLPLTLEAATALDQLISVGDEEDALALLPSLSHPASDAIPIIERWSRSDNPAIVRHALLLLAETGQLTVSIAEGLVATLQADSDRMRYRAALALHASAKGGGTNRVFRVSHTGKQSTETIVSALLWSRSFAPGLASPLYWFFHNLIHDDPAAVAEWIAQAEADGEGSETAQEILEAIELPSPHVVETLILHLPTAAPVAQCAIIRGMGRIVYHKHLPEERWDDLLAALHQVSPETLRAITMVRDGAALVAQTLLTALQQLRQGGAGPEACIDAALATLPSQYETFEALATAGRDAAQDCLSAFGGSNLWSDTYREQVRAAVATLPEDEGVFRLAHAWLDRIDPQANRLERLIASDLLSLLVALAERSPSAFAALEQQEGLEYRLVEIATVHLGFATRMGAITLLGRMRQASPRTVDAFLEGMRASPFEQQATIDAAVRQRLITDDFLGTLLEKLRDEQTSNAYATAQILRALARNAKLPPQQHAAIADALVATIKWLGDRPRRDVYLMTGDWRNGQSNFAIQHRGRLEETLYEALVQISEIAGVGRGSLAAQNTEVANSGVVHAQARRRGKGEQVALVLGECTTKQSPISHQSSMLSEQGLTVEPRIDQAISALGAVAVKHNVSLIDLVEAITVEEASQ